MENILVATDGSDFSDKAVDEAGKIAQKFGAKVTVINVGEKIEGLPAEPSNVRALNSVIEDTVIGSRGKHMSGFKRFVLGSVSREVAEKADSSVYVVK